MALARPAGARALVGLWLWGAALGALGNLALGAYLLLWRGGGPPEARTLLLAAVFTGFGVGISAVGSVAAGARLLREAGRAEPLRLREAAWLLGVPPGLLAGVLYVLYHHPQLQATFVQAFLIPLAVPACLVCLLWAVLGRLVARRHRLRPADFACALFMEHGEYARLKAEREQAGMRP